MQELKIGDEVIRISGPESVMPVGTVRKVQRIGKYNIYLEGHQTSFMKANFELVQPKYPNTPHVHADVIIEWAKGADIQHYSINRCVWYTMEYKPAWFADELYRVAPTQSELADIKTQAKIDKYLAKIEKLKLTLGDKS